MRRGEGTCSFHPGRCCTSIVNGTMFDAPGRLSLGEAVPVKSQGVNWNLARQLLKSEAFDNIATH
jgi:hypothetical protein